VPSEKRRRSKKVARDEHREEVGTMEVDHLRTEVSDTSLMRTLFFLPLLLPPPPPPLVLLLFFPSTPLAARVDLAKSPWCPSASQRPAPPCHFEGSDMVWIDRVSAACVSRIIRRGTTQQPKCHSDIDSSGRNVIRPDWSGLRYIYGEIC